MPDRTRARELAAEFLGKGDPTGWFEALYQEAAAGKSVVPWADLSPTPHLLGFWRANPQATAGKSALVIGSALGDDAEQLSTWGYHTTAFDISETAVLSAVKRYPNTAVKYLVADLLAPPSSLNHQFDFVLEANTLQALQAGLRPRAIEKTVEFLSPGGLLLVIARGRESSDPEGQMPWPLTRAELSAFKTAGLEELSFEDLLSHEEPAEPPVRRFHVLYKSKSV